MDDQQKKIRDCLSSLSFCVKSNRCSFFLAWQLMHANSGVEKGMAAGGKPVEIMGMMLGRPDTESPHALIVTDVSVSHSNRPRLRSIW